MRRCTLIVLWLFAALAWMPAWAGLPETPRPRQLTVAHGLPSNRINGIAEDQHGYLWIATSDGLARYDGIAFRIWRTEQGLRDNFVWSVHVDARNRVWVGTRQGGLAVLDAARSRFRHYDRANTPVLASNDIWSIASTKDGAIWFGTSDAGLYRIAADDRVTRFMPRAGDTRSLPDASIGQLARAPDGSLWIGTKAGVARWNGRDFERVPADALSSPSINGLMVEPDGTLWIGTPAGVSVRRPNGSFSKSPWREVGFRDAIWHVLLRDRAGQYWLDIAAGLGRDGDDQVSVVPLYSEAANGLVRPLWVGGYEDREGGVWFASSNSGLWYLPPNWRRFATLSRRLDDTTTIANAHVRGIAPAANGDMWLVGTGGVLDRLDPESGRVEHVWKDVGAGFVLASVFEDRDGFVWVGYQDGLARIDPIRKQLRRWISDSKRDPAPPGDAYFTQTSDGLIWIATDSNQVEVRDGEGRVQWKVAAGDGRGLPSGTEFQHLGLAPDGTVWIAAARGLFAWNAGSKRFEPVPGAPAEHVYGYAIGHDDRIWLARLGAVESYRWDGEALQLERRIDARHGFPELEPSGLTVDAAGLVWLTSVRGLIRVDPRAESVRVYGVRDGLPGQEFEDGPAARRGDGRILAGSTDGLVLFDPATVRPAEIAPQLTIETVDVRRGDSRMGFTPGRAFSIGHDDRDLRIVARLLSFNDALNHAYRFRLRGYDRDWVDVGSTGERVFSQLKPGQYRLEVKARAADNVWSGAKVIEFSVSPPWWQTWWALAGFAGLAVLLLWTLADTYRTRLKRRHAWLLAEQKRELAEQGSLAKTQFLANLGHEVRTPMTGVLGMSELLLGTPLDPQQRGYAESIHGAGEHLLRLVNEALDLARIESGRLELADEVFELRTLVTDAVKLMEPLAQRKGLAFAATVSADAPRGLRGDPIRVRQILLNLLGNAIKFTEHGSVSLEVSALAPQGVRFDIADTGPGLNEEQLTRLFRRFEQAEGASARYGGSGLGLAICHELTAAMAGAITVDSQPGEGACFNVSLPLAEAVLPENGPSSPAAAPAGRRLCLLLVEDDPTVADVIAGLLRAQGHRVEHAGHALAGLTEAATRRFDAALLDLDLPGMDGFALARQLRAQGFDRPLIAITARADAEAVPQALAAGFDRFMRKPVTGALLNELLEDAVA
ncbi:ligand-binding sensor domain-containing protein [Lysobacter niastensis]|uniref:histidine kinase n=1 Tax=Lysobacter niastensis TaxID=380629 RepID=A0ABS0B2C6_9GAMM|nr:hybrid sensor histidine kinase/response regulator [Lysobacter niastensis]MBF6022627.1 response regulator [Lysobacter niastensis]